MEYLTGIDLQMLVESFGALKPARAIHLIRQACLSLAEAHDEGLVHRDIKPSNLFACKLGRICDIVKVLDFGIVRLTKSEDHLVTGTGQISGTPAFLAPEILQGAQAEPAADTYGIGGVAYWLLTGRPVFEAPNLAALLMMQATQAPDPPSMHMPAIPAELDTIVLDCLAKSPDDRPANAMELRGQLSGVSLDQTWDERVASQWWDSNLLGTKSDIDLTYGDMDRTIEIPPKMNLDDS